MDLRQLDTAGKDVRAWCFACARGERVDTIIWQLFEERGWAMTLPEAAVRFRCRSCQSSADVALFPSRRPPMRQVTNEDLVAAFFFGARAAAKKAKRDPVHDRIMAQLLQRLKEKKR